MKQNYVTKFFFSRRDIYISYNVYFFVFFVMETTRQPFRKERDRETVEFELLFFCKYNRRWRREIQANKWQQTKEHVQQCKMRQII